MCPTTLRKADTALVDGYFKVGTVWRSLAYCSNLRSLEIRVHAKGVDEETRSLNDHWHIASEVVAHLSPTLATLQEVRFLVYTPTFKLKDTFMFPLPGGGCYDHDCSNITEKLMGLPVPPVVSCGTLMEDGTSCTRRDEAAIRLLFPDLHAAGLLRPCTDDELNARELAYFGHEEVWWEVRGEESPDDEDFEDTYDELPSEWVNHKMGHPTGDLIVI